MNKIINAISYIDEKEILKFIDSIGFNNRYTNKQFIYLIRRFLINIFNIFSYFFKFN